MFNTSLSMITDQKPVDNCLFEVFKHVINLDLLTDNRSGSPAGAKNLAVSIKTLAEAVTTECADF